jgi:hypothetical protein
MSNLELSMSRQMRYEAESSDGIRDEIKMRENGLSFGTTSRKNPREARRQEGCFSTPMFPEEKKLGMDPRGKKRRDAMEVQQREAARLDRAPPWEGRGG